VDPEEAGKVLWIAKGLQTGSVIVFRDPKVVMELEDPRVIVQKYIKPQGGVRRELKVFSLFMAVNGVHKAYVFDQALVKVYMADGSGGKQVIGFSLDEGSESWEVEDMDREGYCYVKKRAVEIVREWMQATYFKIDPFKRLNTFQILTYNFIITKVSESYQVLLISVSPTPFSVLKPPKIISPFSEESICTIKNIFEKSKVKEQESKNPKLISLDEQSKLMKGILESLIECTFKLVLDPLTYMKNGKMIPIDPNMHTLSNFIWIFNSKKDAKTLQKSKILLKEEVDEELMKLYI
jgi:hypothetical protein